MLVLIRNDLKDYINRTSALVIKPKLTIIVAISTRLSNDDAAIKVYKEWKSGNINTILAITININLKPLTLITSCLIVKEI